MTLFAVAADAFANLPFSVDRSIDRRPSFVRSFVRSFGVGSTFDSRILVCHSDGRTTCVTGRKWRGRTDGRTTRTALAILRSVDKTALARSLGEKKKEKEKEKRKRSNEWGLLPSFPLPPSFFPAPLSLSLSLPLCLQFKCHLRREGRGERRGGEEREGRREERRSKYDKREMHSKLSQIGSFSERPPALLGTTGTTNARSPLITC